MAQSVTAAPDAEFIALQSALAGEFSLERELGRGGMGIVYLAREVQLERPVAIKVLPPALATRADLRERFMREARTAAKLSHPNIVPIFRVDDVGGFVFFVMAYVDGETLAQRVRTRGPLPPDVATRLIQEVAWALAYAHARGVVHRDIKPDNILIERGTSRAMVTDFGIAHVTQAGALTEVGQVMGTAHFMSPEQAAGEPLDGRSDLYSLGVVAHFALTAKLPFDGPSVQAVLAKHMTQPPPALASVDSAIPRALAQAVDRCLAKDPAARYPSGEALAEALTLASGQRRETPAPVRVWLQKGNLFKVVYPVWYLFVALPSVLDPGWWTAIVLLAPLLVHVKFEVVNARRLFAAGYDFETMKLALREHVQRRNEELAFEYGHVTFIGRILRVVTYTALGVTVATTAVAAFALSRFEWTAVATVFGVSCFVTVLSAVAGLFNPGRPIRRRDYLNELRSRFWNSRLGERFARLASWRLERALAAEVAHRPTELAIGVAAADLYAALPKRMQQRLRGLPDVVRRLEGEARSMRERIATMGDKLATVEADEVTGRSAVLDRYGGDTEALSERRGRVVEELRAARDAAGKRLAAIVAELENIRLDLLRLQAGAGDVNELTTALDAAGRIAADIDAAVADRRRVGVALHDA